jgi:hypothetical protein
MIDYVCELCCSGLQYCIVMWVVTSITEEHITSRVTTQKTTIHVFTAMKFSDSLIVVVCSFTDVL